MGPEHFKGKRNSPLMNGWTQEKTREFAGVKYDQRSGVRACLRCKEDFQSEYPGDRKCKPCRKKKGPI